MLAHFAHHVITALPQPLLPLIRDEFNLSYTMSALVQSTFAWTYGVAQIPAGFLADRIGPRILLLVGVIGVAAAGIIVGLSQNYVMLLIFMVVMGILGGGYHPAAAPMVSAAARPENRGKALGFHEIGANASFLVAPIAAAAIATAGGWRSSFFSLSAPMLLFGLFMIKYTRRPRKPVAVDSEVAETGEVGPEKGRLRRLVAFLLLSVLTGGIVSSVFAFITLYAVDNLGASTTGAASFLALMSLSGIVVSPLAGHISDRLGRVPLIVASSLLSAFVVYMLNWATYYWGMAGLMLLLGVATFTRMPVSEAYIIGQTTERNRSLVYGIYYFSMTETGAVFAPIMGYLIDNHGFHNCFNWAAVAIVVVTVVFSLFLRGSRN